MNRTGVVLVEVLVAIVILASAGLSALTYLGQFNATQQAFFAAERELLDVEQTLIVTSLLRTRELDQRLGTRAVGVHLVSVSRPEQALYRIGVAHIDNPTNELLSTVVYRPEPRVR